MMSLIWSNIISHVRFDVNTNTSAISVSVPPHYTIPWNGNFRVICSIMESLVWLRATESWVWWRAWCDWELSVMENRLWWRAWCDWKLGVMESWYDGELVVMESYWELDMMESYWQLGMMDTWVWLRDTGAGCDRELLIGGCDGELLRTGCDGELLSAGYDGKLGVIESWVWWWATESWMWWRDECNGELCVMESHWELSEMGDGELGAMESCMGVMDIYRYFCVT